MNVMKKAAVGFAALAMVAAPVVASAAPVFDLRALSDAEDSGEFANSKSWLPMGLGLAALVGLIVVVADDSPSSP